MIDNHISIHFERSTIISRNPTLLNDKKGYIQMFTE